MLRDDPLVKRGDASELRPAPHSARLQHPAASQMEVDRERPVSKASPLSDIVINVIVAYTAKAASKYADFERELIDFAIEEAKSFRNSNLGRVRLNLVHAYQTDYLDAVMGPAPQLKGKVAVSR
jgi:hypothetical protein